MKQSVFKKVTRLVGKAIGDFGLIADRDRVLVALSGGKDSWTLLYALLELQRKAPVEFELAAVTIVPGPGRFDIVPLEERLSRDRIPHRVIDGNLTRIVDNHLTPGTNPCAFCARLRRGILYSYASREGWNKIALGHHLDDIVETLLLNLFFNASIKGMSPNLPADDGKNTVIRPLAYVREEMTSAAAQFLGVPLISCLCPLSSCVCPRQKESGSMRHWIKALLAKVEKEIPGAKSSLLTAMGRVHHRHLMTQWKSGLTNRTEEPGSGASTLEK